MDIFSGKSDRGRVINLGGGTTKASRSSLLQKTQNQREKRKLFRLKESSAIILQKHIRGYLDLSDQRKIIRDNWESSNSAQINIDNAVYEFVFFFPYYVDTDGDKLTKLSRSLKGKYDTISYWNLKALFNCIVKVIDKYPIIIINVLSSIISTNTFSSIFKTEYYKDFEINELSKYMANHLIEIPLKDVMIIITKGFKANDILILLSNPGFNEFLSDQSMIDVILNHLEILEALETLSNFEDDDKIQILSNLSITLSGQTNLTESNNLTLVNLIIVLLDSIDSSIKFEKIPKSILKNLNYLFSKDFLQTIFKLIHDKKLSETKLSTLYSNLIKLQGNLNSGSNSVFLYLFLFGLHDLKKLIFHNFDVEVMELDDDLSFENLNNNRKLFNHIISLPESQLVVTNNMNFLEKTFLPGNSLNEKFFFKDLYLFLEILSYWLVIATDLEIKNLPESNDDLNSQQFLSSKELKEFTKFIKNFSLLLCWNEQIIMRKLNGDTQNDKLFTDSAFGNTSSVFDKAEIRDERIEKSKIFTNDFNLLKDLTFRVINQLNLIDSKIHMFPEEFWEVEDHKISDVDRLIPIIATEEETEEIIEEEDKEDEDYEEEEKPIQSIKNQFGVRTTTFKLKGSSNNDIEGIFRILNFLPFFIKFHDRVKIFQMLISLDRQKGKYVRSSFNQFSFLNGVPQVSKNKATVHRDYLLEDAYKSYGRLNDSFKFPLSVTFIDKYGKEEAGIDGGGVTKEFLTSLANEGFIKKDIFVENKNHQLFPNPNTWLNLKYNQDFLKKNGLKEFELKKLNYLEFLGKLIGKCLYEQILVEVNFVPSFLKKWRNSVGKFFTFDDLKEIDPDLYNGLNKLLKLNDDFFSTSELNFSVDEKIKFFRPSIKEFSIETNDYIEVEKEIDFEKLLHIDLINNGSNILVNNSNKLKFINLITNFKLTKSLDSQIDLFLKGLYQIIPSHWLNMFNPKELQMLISGGEKEIDIEDLKNNVHYGGYTKDDLIIQFFWECVEEMSNEERSKLIKFVTSVPRPPLLGFKELVPKFGISKSDGSENKLPTSSTCVNLLKLPVYKSKERLKEKLLYAIKAEAGFDLS